MGRLGAVFAISLQTEYFFSKMKFILLLYIHLFSNAGDWVQDFRAIYANALALIFITGP